MIIRNILSKFLITLFCCLLISAHANASGSQASYFSNGYHDSDTTSGGAMIVDAVFARPLGFVATVIGTAVYTVSLPFSIAGGNEHDARKNLVYSPAGYTFKRPLGQF